MGFVRGDRPPASATCPWESGEGRSAISLTALRNGLPPFVGRCGSLPWGRGPVYCTIDRKREGAADAGANQRGVDGYEQWIRLLDTAGDLRAFLEENKSRLKLRNET